MQIPSIKDKAVLRDSAKISKEIQYIPNKEYEEYWSAVYSYIQTFNPTSPTQDFQKHINPYFGYFGKTFHPIKKISRYINIGVAITEKLKTPVQSILLGNLEYSGFGITNGYYVFVSHPEIMTEDGFTLGSLYLHLKQPLVSFSRYQKMLRQISFNSYPEVQIKKGELIGEVGDSGNTKGLHANLFFQVCFWKDNEFIFIDPIRIFGEEPKENLSKDFLIENFDLLINSSKSELERLEINKYWTKD